MYEAPEDYCGLITVADPPGPTDGGASVCDARRTDVASYR